MTSESDGEDVIGNLFGLSGAVVAEKERLGRRPEHFLHAILGSRCRRARE
jgi:hypothetical protein